MPYGRDCLHDNEEELPESDDELIMTVLYDLGIQERPDIERERSTSINATTSARSSYTAVDETSPRCSIAVSEDSDGWTIAVRKSTDERLTQASAERQELKEQVTFLTREVQRLRAGVLTEREQEREQIEDLKRKLHESQVRLERWQNGCRQLRLENQRLRATRSGLERQNNSGIESHIDSLHDENLDTVGHLNTIREVDLDTAYSLTSMTSEASSSPSSSSTSIAPTIRRVIR